MRKISYYIILFLAGLVLACDGVDEDAAKEKEKRLLERYLIENNITVRPTASGLYHIILREGTGNKPVPENFLVIEYTASLINGVIFDTTDELLARESNIYNPNSLYGPFKFQLDKISMKGFSEGLLLMRKGEKARLIIPSRIGFGGVAIGNVPAFSTLIYDIELLDIITNPILHEESLITQYILENSITAPPTSSGLYYIETQTGTTNMVESGMRVVLHFTGKLLDGRVFESTAGRVPYEFIIDRSAVIAGINEGVKLMRAGGGKAKLIIPSKLAFGATGSADGKIPPYTTLLFEVELIEAYFP